MKKLRTIEEENEIRNESEVLSCSGTYEESKITGWKETGIDSGFGGEILEAVYNCFPMRDTFNDYVDIKCSKTKKKGKMYEKGIRCVIERIEWDDGSKGYDRLEEI